jgi:hypothetical protein
VTIAGFKALCARVAAHLVEHPDDTVEEIRTALLEVYESIDSAQLSRAIAAVKRADGDQALDAIRDTLARGGLALPPATVRAFPTGPKAKPPDDDLLVPQEFVDAYARLCNGFDRTMRPGTRREYFRVLIDVQGCTVDELSQAADDVLVHGQHFPRIADWFAAVVTVRKRRKAREWQGPGEVFKDAEGNWDWKCHRCRDTGWRPACGCDVGTLAVNAGFCSLHPRIENGVEYRPRFTRCECQARA